MTDQFWFRRRCVFCRTVKTYNKNEYGHANCDACAAAAERRAAEKPRHCPIDGTPLQLRTMPVVTDMPASGCADCGGFWLTTYELRTLIEHVGRNSRTYVFAGGGGGDGGGGGGE